MGAELRDSPGTRERELFLGAMERSSAVERAAFLDAGCGQDQALRRRVEELLGEQEDVGRFLETPALAGMGVLSSPSGVGPSGTVLIGTITEKPGDRIGRYKLLQKIGEGGCGIVYMAEQEEPVRRRVALKVIKLGMDTKIVIARFEAERQALAMMDHQNIAKVLDAGATETGRPFFVMELVRGIRITEYCDQNNLSTEERLVLFAQVCRAIQHAHQKGIIHRDIKPSNLLVTLHDGLPVPKVIDFGIAKAIEQRLTDKTLFTEFSAFIGTPAYMSPEQAEMSGLDIDTRSDIYSLGVLLYELLTGKTPFDAEALLRNGLDECRRTIREREPVRPSTRVATMLDQELTTTAKQRRTEAPKLIHSLRGDLDWIVMKCLEKDRARRYDTAHDVALDVQRYLESEPVLARPPSNLYRLQKVLHRHRGAFAAAAAIAVTLISGITISTWQAVRATGAEHRAESSQQKEANLRRRAQQGEEAAHLNEYVADINLAQQSLAADNYGRAMQLLNKHRPQPGASDLRGFEWRYLWQLCQGDQHAALPRQGEAVHSLAFSPNGDLLAIGLFDKVNIFNPHTKSLVTSVRPGGFSLAFFPDGKTLATARGSLRLWNASDWKERQSFPDGSAPFVVSADATRLATSKREGGISIWDTATWKEVRFLSDASAPMAFSPDGKTFAAEAEAGITLWPLEGARHEVVLRDSTNVFMRMGGPRSRSDPRFLGQQHTLAFSPDGKSVLAARNTLSRRGVFVLSLWDAQSGEETGVMPEDPEHIEHTGIISSLAFSPDGRTLATASRDYSIRLWDFATRQRRTTLQGHLSEVWSLAFSPDGQTLASGAKDGSVNLWPTQSQPKEDIIEGGWQPMAFSKDSRVLAARTRQGTVAFFNLATHEPDQQFQLKPPSEGFRRRPPSPHPAALSEDLGILAQAVDDGMVKIWNTETHETNLLKVSERAVDLLALSPDGRTLITSEEGGMPVPGRRGHTLRWWDLRQGTNTVLSIENCNKLLFSPDGRTVAAFQRGNTAQLWDAATRALRTNLVIETQTGSPTNSPFDFRNLPSAFSADSRLLAIAASDDTIRLLDVLTGRLVGACSGHKQAVSSVAFSPDGKTLASASDDSTLKFWNVATQQELLTVRRLGGTLRGLLFSPDGRLLVGASGFSAPSDGLRFFHARPLGETDLASVIEQH